MGGEAGGGHHSDFGTVGEGSEEFLRGGQEELGNVLVHKFLPAPERNYPQSPGQPLGRRHNKPSRMDKGKQLQQIQPRQFRIAEPLRHQRRVEHDKRRLRCPPHSLALADRPHFAIRRGEPDTRMACMKRWKG